MATNVTLNGSTFSIPRTGDSSWSATGGVDDYMVALATGVLQKAGGAFTLSAEVDFGASHGLKALYLKSRGTTPATAGVLRLANAEALSWRNQGNSANLDLKVNAANVLEFNGNPLVTLALGTADQALKMNAGGTAYEWGKLADANIDAAAAITLSKLAALTASKALVSDGSGVITASAVTSTELGYLSGVTSAVQTQLGTHTTNIATNATNLATHISDLANPHAVTKTQVGLGSVDNTSDATKNAASATLTNKTISGASNTITNVSLTTGVTGTLPLANGGTGQTSASTAINALVPSQTGNANKVLTTDGSAVSWGAGGGSGAGELNVITNPSAASDTTGWTASGTCTVTRLSASSPLDPVIATALRMAAGSATNYVEYTASVPTSLRNRKLKIEWHQTAPTSGEWKVDLYNTAGSTRYSLSTDSSSVSAIPAQTGKYSTTFDMDSGTSVKLRFVRVSGSGNLDVTNVIVGPGIAPQGAVVGTPQAYTPTATGMTFSSSDFTWRQVGTKMHLTGKFALSAVSGSTAAITLPSGYTTATTTALVAGKWTRLDSGAGNIVKQGTVLLISGGTALNFSVDDYTAAIDPDAAQLGNAIFGASSYAFDGEIIVPIAEWAGSGTVNLAQNDVEYAYNTSTALADDTTSFGYGPDGVQFASYTTNWRKRVRFRNYQTTDQVILEVYDQSGWVPIQQSFATPLSATTGISVRPVVGSPGDFDVYFGSAGYAATPQSTAGAWSTVASSNSYRWRLRKTSGGQAVGFSEVVPGISSGLVSASGLKGNSGTAPATSYVGEYNTSSGSNTGTLTSNTDTQAHTVTLGAGVWEVWGSVIFSVTGADATTEKLLSSCISSSSTPAMEEGYFQTVYGKAMNQSGFRYQVARRRFVLPSSTPVYMHVKQLSVSGTAGTTIAASPVIYYTRVA